MANLVLGVAGAAVGFMVGGPMGAQMGFMAGSAVGGALFPPKGQDGPRLNDLAVQVSSYGQPITRLWGTHRIAGNVIWSTDLVEHEAEQGGKGGSSYSTFSYTSSFAVYLCEGEIDGVRRIWADGKLIYDISTTNLGNQIGFTASSFVVYHGTEAQVEDPTIQAHIGDTPAYRGMAYCVFADLQLEKFGNRIPNLTFEVVKDGVVGQRAATTFGEHYIAGGGTSEFECDINFSGTELWVSTMSGHPDEDYEALAVPMIKSYDPYTHALLYQYEVPMERIEVDFGWVECYPIGGYGICYGDYYFVGRGAPGPARLGAEVFCGGGVSCGNPNPYIHATVVGPAHSIFYINDSESSGQFQNAFYWPSVPVRSGFEPQVDGSILTGHWVGMASGNGIVSEFGVNFKQTYKSMGGGYSQMPEGRSHCQCDYYSPADVFSGFSIKTPGWAFKAVACRPELTAILGYQDTNHFYLSMGTEADDVTVIAGSGVTMPAACWDEVRQVLWLFGGEDYNTLYANGVITDFVFPPIFSGTQNTWVKGMTIDQRTGMLRLLVGGGLDYPVHLVLLNPDQSIDPVTGLLLPMEIVETQELTIHVASTNGKLWDFPTQGKVIYANGYYLYDIPYGHTLAPAPVLLSLIVTEISAEVGLTPEQIDVTELTDLVWGFVIARQGAARSAIEQLMMAFSFDAVESEGKVKFVKRGKPPCVTLTEDDLAVHDYGQATPTALPLTRADEAELPRNVTIKYTDLDTDYMTGAQSASRQTGRALAEMTVEMPVALSSASAKAIADYALYSAWVARTTTKWSTSLAFAKYEPTDIVSIDGNPIRISKRSQQNNILTFEGTFDSGTILTAGAVAGTAEGQASQTIALPVKTLLALLNVPMLRDQDEDAGFYAAACGLSTPWAGCLLVKSADDGASFSSVTSLLSAATMGIASALEDFTPNMFDEFNTFTVRLFSGSLSSATELAVLNGANVAVLGGEILQFKTATLGLDGNYTISGLLRGRNGSLTSGHGGGETFVLVSSSTLERIPAATAEIGLSRLYKGVTLGTSYASADNVDFATTAQALECVSPVHLGAGRDASDNLTIIWQRRTRKGGEWRDNVDASLGEDAEAYEIDVFEDDTYAVVLRTITATATTANYTAAEQTTDFGSAQSTVYVRIYQISAAVGRGAPLEGGI
jgi:hypothetical protein